MKAPERPEISQNEMGVGYVSVRGARENNLKNVDLDIPRNSLVVFTGISGSGKSSLAFGTLYAEAQRRYLESVSPYARRLFHQLSIPEVDQIDGLPPAVALQQQRGSPTTRSSVGSVTTLSNLLRMLYSRAGTYPRKQEHLDAESFSPNTPAGACPKCHGLGKVYAVTERLMVPDDTLTIRERAVAAWPPAWHGTNLRDMLISLGHDVDVRWRDLPKNVRNWILFTDEQPSVPVYIGFSPKEVQRALKRKEEPSYQGHFSSARRYVLDTFAKTPSALMKRRVSKFMESATCSSCHGKRLRRESLSVTFAGFDIAEISEFPLKRLAALFEPYAKGTCKEFKTLSAKHPEKVIAAQRIAEDAVSRLKVMLDLGLGYLSLERSTPTLSPGELQRLRLATQVRSNLFGVVYVLDEPSAGLHPVDTQALLGALDQLKASGNSLFVVEHELDIIRHADWIVDIGPEAGEYGGEVVYNGPLEGLREIKGSKTARYLFKNYNPPSRVRRKPKKWLTLSGVKRNNVDNLDIAFPLSVLTTVTGVSGSGKSTLVSQVLAELVSKQLGENLPPEEDDGSELERTPIETLGGRISGGMESIKRLVLVDQKPIGRTPRSNLATYTGFFDHIRKLFASTKTAKSRHYDAGRFSFNIAKGRCETCQGEGSIMVELLFLPSVYAPCPACHGTRYNSKTLKVKYRDKSIADVLAMTVDEADEFFQQDGQEIRALTVLKEVGLGYLRLGQPATELSGGEAQRIKLATELQRTQRGNTLYLLDEPTTGLHPSDVERLMEQLHGLVDAGNTVITVEHDMYVVAESDWVIDIGPGAGEEGGKIVVSAPPNEVAKSKLSKTAQYLQIQLTNSQIV